MLCGPVTVVVVVVAVVVAVVVVETIHPVMVAADPVVVSVVLDAQAVRVVQVVQAVQQVVGMAGLGMRVVKKQTVTVKIQFSL